MANYYLDENGKLTTKKKKKNISTNYYLDGNGKLTVAAPDDIAPVKEDRTWFQKGAFADGYDFGDITRTILGTKKDFKENIYAGVIGIAESAIDAGAYVAGGVGGMVGADGFKNKMQNFIEKDLIDEKKVAKTMDNITGGATSWLTLLKPEFDAQQNSILGDKSGGLLQSAGQLAGTAGLQMVGVPWYVTTGVTSFGGQAESAFKEGATYGEAGGSAAISAAAEILTEKLSGGIKFGGKTLDDVVLRPLTQKISSKAARTIVNLGLDAAGEGAEEVITEFVSTLGEQLTYEKEETWAELLNNEEAMDAYINQVADSLFGEEAREAYKEAAIGGAVLGGGLNIGRAAKSIATGRDYKTGLTENEQTVINKEVENRIKEREEAGETLSNRDKSDIEEQVKSDLAKGYISIDTIESALGGDAYNSYKAMTDKEAALKKEIETLENTPKEQITVKQSERLTEARQELENLDIHTAKEQLGMQVSDMAKSDRLAESYNEKARRSQAFEADLKKYDAKQQEVVKNAIESGILNNTNKTHDFVDMIAKISAEKGVSFDFTNNQKLKESGFAVEGKTINGYVKDGNIAVNIDSAKSLNSVVGHEITHVLEGTELYGELQKAVKEYATTKGEYRKRFIDMTQLYKGVEGADIDAEITADLVGDYLFTDSDFINKLSTEKPNIFKRIYEEIKYLVKLATAGSAEARQLEKVKRAFDKAYKESGKASADTKYSVSDKNIKDVSTGYAYGETYFNMTYTQDGKVVGTLEYGVYEGEPNVKMIEVAPEYRRQGIGTKLLQELQNKYPDAEINFGMTTPDGTKLLESVTYDVTDEAVVADKQKLKELQTELNELQEKLDVLYDTENLSEEQRAELDRLGDRWTEVYDAIRELNESLRGKKATKTFVKTDGVKYSISDSEGHQLTKEQQDYFKDSKVRDENGNLKVMYHGSQNAGFHEFNQRFSDDDISFFFVDNNDIAKGYSGTHETYAPKAMKTAEDLNGFFKEIKATDYTATEENGTFTLYENGDEVATSDTADGLLEEFRDWTGLGYGSVNYKVYLNLKNPLIVDAQNNNWDDLPPIEGSEVYDYIKVVSVGDGPGDVTIEYATSTDSAPITEIVDLYEKFEGGLAERLSDLAPGESVQNVPVSPMKTRDYAKYAKENGYDGVIFNNIVDAGLYASSRERYTPSTVAVAFNASQIKSTENTAPTSNPDIRYSLSADSEGRNLTTEQKKYFKGSKVVDDNGNLKVVYHGSPASFNQFSLEYLGTNGTAEGYGFYFTDKKNIAERYSRGLEGQPSEGSTGKLFEVYLDIKKPLSDTDVTMSRAEFKKFLLELNSQTDADGEPLDVLSNYGDVSWEGFNKVLNYAMEIEYDGSDSDVNLVHSIINGTGNMETVLDVLRKTTGYDGIIVNEATWGDGQTIYLAFHPEQIKNVDNLTPTTDPDIRKSLSEGSEHPSQRGNYNVYGSDVALQQDIAPVAEEVQEQPEITPEPVEAVQEDVAPVVSDVEVTESVDWREEVRNMREPKLYYGSWREEYIDYHNTVRRNAQMAALREALDNFDSGMTPAELRQKAREALEEYESTKPASGEEYTQAQEVMLAALYGQYSFYNTVAENPSWAEEMRAQLEQPMMTNEPAPMTEEQANERDEQQLERLYSLDENSDMPIEPDVQAEDFAPIADNASVESPFDKKDIKEVGNRKIKAYMYENPEVKPFFQEEARNMLGELKSSIKGEKWYNGNLHYETSGDLGWFGTDRMTSPEIAYLLDNFKYTYAQIEKGLNDIIEDHGAENNAVSKRIEFMLDERLREGYSHFMYGDAIPPNQDYINLLAEKQITEYNDEAFNRWAATLKGSDVPDIGPVREDVKPAAAEPAPLYDAQPKKGVTEGQLSMFNEAEQQPVTHLDRVLKRIDNRLQREKAELAEEFRQKKAVLQEQIGDKNAFFSSQAKALYDEIRSLRKGVRASKQLGYLLDYGYDWNHVKRALLNIYHHPESRVNENLVPESIAREMLETEYESRMYDLDNLDTEYQKQIQELEKDAETERSSAEKAEHGLKRKELHANIIQDMKSEFASKGYDLDDVLKNAKNLLTFATVDNTPQRVMEKALGYKEGSVLSDLTVNKVAQNESEGIKWLNSFTDRKNGLLAKISKQYGIKPGSKESAAAQMYAEGFFVDENNDIIAYGDAELAKDFPNRRVQENIKALAKDGRIRRIYDETLKMINESRTRNAYPEIPRLENYFLHFRAMDDTFSKLGLPFNPNEIKANDLPTDLNGVTADLKPGQPYFASAMHRTGKRTSFDLLGGLERYLTSAKNQIYHIDDIQNLRALRNYIADIYGQAKGLENIDMLTEEEAQERIAKVYSSHLSTFAKFLNEEANVLAGKKTLMDRGFEEAFGRRGLSLMDTINRQVGANMVGFNVSSSLTNFIAVAQAVAKSNKAAFVKAFAQTTSNKLGSIVGRSDGFAEQSPVMVRRKGAERFQRNLWQKAQDAGYFLMSAVDNISTELIARTKYNEFISKGMDAQKAHYETDKWVSKLMGDRSLGQQPHLYNSKFLGVFTKFQLEVRNQLDSQFYDTIQEAKVSNEEIQNKLARNAKTAAKVTSTFFQLAVAQHLFGKAFESIAGYNPAFDIISALIKTLGLDDDDESEDTVLDNVEQGFLELVGDLPYSSLVLDGGRIPIASALPVTQFLTGKDDYGNDKSRLETFKETVPYYLLPGGYGQIKKTTQGLGMFDDDLPIAGSYTDSGNLRFTVEDTPANRLQAGLFGQWASDEARDYFDNERKPLQQKQIQELVDLDLPIRDYWNYRSGLSEQKMLEDKFEYINSQPVSVDQKNIMINNVVDRKEPVDMTNYNDFADYEEFDFYSKNTEKYNFLEENGISYLEYISSEEAKKEYDSAYSWAKNNPDKVTVAKAVADNVVQYRKYTSNLADFRADKDENGKTINGSAKQKKIDYINGLGLSYGQKLLLFKSQFKEDDTYNSEILEYLNNRPDLTYKSIETILRELGFTVHRDGTVEW